MAILASLLANQWAGKDSERASPADFIPDFLGERREARGRQMTLEESIAWARQQEG